MVSSLLGRVLSSRRAADDDAFLEKILVKAGIALANSEPKEWRRVQESIDMLEEPFYSKALVSVIEIMAKMGKFRQARETALAISMNQNGWRAVAFKIIHSYSRAGQDLEYANEFLEHVKSEEQREAIRDCFGRQPSDGCSSDRVCSLYGREGSFLAIFPEALMALLDVELP